MGDWDRVCVGTALSVVLCIDCWAASRAHSDPGAHVGFPNLNVCGQRHLNESVRSLCVGVLVGHA